MDLVPPLSKYWGVEILSTCYGKKIPAEKGPVMIEHVDCLNRLMQLPALHGALKKKLSLENKPDAILHFPFGTFTGFRGAINKWSMRMVDRIASIHGMRCLTILYSVTKGDLAVLSKKVGLMAASGGNDWNGPVVNMGINPERLHLIRERENNKKLLFMAGISENKKGLLKNILYVRGLIDIIKIGDRLAGYGFTLTIAAPILKHPKRLGELLDLLKNTAPSLKVNIETLVDVNNFFKDHGMYLFPFRENLTRFVPTSVLEAMASGIPVITSDLPMLDSIFAANPNCAKRFAAGDSEALLWAILDRSNNWEEAVKGAALASDHVRKLWDIRNSAKQIVDIMERQELP